MRAGLDLDGAVAAGGADELADRPAGTVLDPAGHGQGGEHDREVRVDRLTLVVVDRPGLQVVFGHAEGLLDVEEPVAGVDDKLGGRVEIGDVALEAGQTSGLGLQLPVDTLGRAGQLDEPVAFDRALPATALAALATCSSMPPSPPA
jgi:hypothetical protein